MVVFKVKKTIKSMMIIIICIILMMFVNIVYAAIYTNLPVSTISDTFPASYQSYIDNLKKIYPNATFKAVNTGLDWNTVVQHESYELYLLNNNEEGALKRSLVPISYGNEWKYTGKDIYKDKYFITASKDAVAYVLDPRNSLSEKYVFQFNVLTHNEAMNSTVVDKVFSGRELVGIHKNQYQSTTAGNWITMDMTYSELVVKVAKELDVGSVYIASRMVQETGGEISTNSSINGIYPGYEGLYNFFNIKAFDGDNINGLKYARAQGWTTPYKSIYGGVDIIKSRYIKYGQYTVYFQKFDVNNPYGNATVLMGMQYQTNILAPRSESLISYAAYKKLNMLDTAFVFYIPVYNNMPSKACAEPGTDTGSTTTDINISDSGITGVDPGTTVGGLKSKIVAEDMTVVIKNVSGVVIDDTANVGTGCTVELQTGAGEVAESYPVTIYGDVNGDGKISPSDYVKVKNKILGKENMDNKYCENAADLNKDGKISPSDYVKIKNYILKKERIVQ